MLKSEIESLIIPIINNDLEQQEANLFIEFAKMTNEDLSTAYNIIESKLLNMCDYSTPDDPLYAYYLAIQKNLSLIIIARFNELFNK